VRNLLHDQVTQPGSQDVEQRWVRLIADEAAFRNDITLDDSELSPALG
jgi:hypothetical protein